MISETQLKENQECVRRHLQFENAQDMEGTLSTLHTDCIFEDLPLKKVYRGIDGARQYYAELGNASRGMSIRLPLVVIVTFREGLMAGERFYYDLADLLRQIGAQHPNT
jgi:hypothetical protein